MEDKKILIIEDDEFLLQMYATKLELEGFSVLEATNGREGLKIAKKEKPDLILLDLNLPEMDGFTVLSHLRNEEGGKDYKVIILTNYSQREHIDRCLELKADDYLIKAHFVPSEVIKKIKNILGLT